MKFVGDDSEQGLALRLRKGESGAMRDFYARYAKIITAICARYIADDDDVSDAVQDTLVAIFSKIGKYTYRGEGSLKAWASRIAVNTSLDMLRASSRVTTVPIDDNRHDIVEEDIAVDKIPPNVIHEAIRQLPDGYRTVFNLYAIDHLSHREIADKLGIREASSASQYLRAKRILASKLKEYLRQNDR